LKLEFDKTYFISRVVYYYKFYTHWYSPSGVCYPSEDKFRACVDNNTDIDVSVYQREKKQKSCGTLRLTYGLEQSDQIYTLICNIAGDSVKLSREAAADGDKLLVYEVVVTGTGSYNLKFEQESGSESKNSLHNRLLLICENIFVALAPELMCDK
jgi:hypothetical protein